MHVRDSALRQASRQRVGMEVGMAARLRNRTDVRYLRDVVRGQQCHERVDGVRGVSNGPHPHRRQLAPAVWCRASC